MLRACLTGAFAHALLLLGASGAVAAPRDISTGDMFDFCAATDIETSQMVCTFYVTGFLHGAVAGAGTSRGGLVCLPNFFTPNEAIQIFLRDIRNNPEEKTYPVSVTMSAALARQFPCGKKTK